MFIFFQWCHLTGPKWDGDPLTPPLSRPELLALWSVTHHPLLPLPPMLCPVTMASPTAAAVCRTGTDRGLDTAAHTPLTPTGPPMITCCTDTSTTHYHQQVSFTNGSAGLYWETCLSVLLSSLKRTLATRKTSRILGCTWFSHCHPTPPHLWPASGQTGRCLLSATSKHASLCVSSADPHCKDRECVPECTVTLISPGICHLSNVTGAEPRCPRQKEMWSLISTLRQPPGHYPAGTAVCSSCSSYFSACIRAAAFWTGSRHYTTFTCTHAAFVFLTHTHIQNTLS